MPADSRFAGTWTNVTVNGVSFSVSDEAVEREDDHRLGVGAGAIKIWLCNWADRTRIKAALLGGSTNVGGGVVFANGWQYPDNPNWFVQHVETRPVGLPSVGANGHIQYEYARLKITFTPPNFDFAQLQAIGELHCHGASQSIPLDQAAATFKFSSDNQDIAALQRSFVEFSIMEISLTLYDRIGFNGPLVNSLTDCTNNAIFYGAAVESVRFRSAETDRQEITQNTIKYATTLFFAWHPIAGGWGKLPRPGFSPLWQPYVVKATGLKEFPPADITQLLRM